MDYPRQHPRTRIVTAAALELAKAVRAVFEKHELTGAEEISIVTAELARYVGTATKHMIRAERHPNDPDRPGDLE